MAVSRIRKVETKKQMDSLVDDYVTQGYTIASQGAGTTLVVKKAGNRPVIHIVLAVCFWWTLFFPNFLYWLLSRKKDEILVKVEAE